MGGAGAPPDLNDFFPLFFQKINTNNTLIFPYLFSQKNIANNITLIGYPNRPHVKDLPGLARANSLKLVTFFGGKKVGKN